MWQSITLAAGFLGILIPFVVFPSMPTIFVPDHSPIRLFAKVLALLTVVVAISTVVWCGAFLYLSSWPLLQLSLLAVASLVAGFAVCSAVIAALTYWP